MALLQSDKQQNGTLSPKKLKQIIEKYTMPVSEEHFHE